LHPLEEVWARVAVRQRIMEDELRCGRAAANQQCRELQQLRKELARLQEENVRKEARLQARLCVLEASASEATSESRSEVSATAASSAVAEEDEEVPLPSVRSLVEALERRSSASVSAGARPVAVQLEPCAPA